MMKYFGLPLLGSEHGADVDKLIFYLHVLMAVLLLGWGLYFIYALFRFSKARNPKADYVGTTTHASSYIEVGVAVAEMVLLFGMAVPYWAKSVDKFPDAAQSTVMRIIGRQFNWVAQYPGPDGQFGKQDIRIVSSQNALGLHQRDPKLAPQDAGGKDDVVVESSEMAVPVNKPVIAHISSLDVIHSFKVVPLRVTQDATPGMNIPIHFIPTITNTYQIQCSQLCGNGHYSMRGFFKVLDQADYDTWIKGKSGAGAAPASYE